MLSRGKRWELVHTWQCCCCIPSPNLNILSVHYESSSSSKKFVSIDLYNLHNPVKRFDITTVYRWGDWCIEFAQNYLLPLQSGSIVPTQLQLGVGVYGGHWDARHLSWVSKTSPPCSSQWIQTTVLSPNSVVVLMLWEGAVLSSCLSTRTCDDYSHTGVCLSIDLGALETQEGRKWVENVNAISEAVF